MFTFNINIGNTHHVLQVDTYEQAAKRAKEKFKIEDAQIDSIVNIGPTIGAPNPYLQ